MRNGMPDKWKWQQMLHQAMLVFAMGIAVGGVTAAVCEGSTFIDHMERIAGLQSAEGDRQNTKADPKMAGRPGRAGRPRF